MIALPNKAPIFIGDLTSTLSVELGSILNYTLPEIFDFNGDTYNITLEPETEAIFIDDQRHIIIDGKEQGIREISMGGGW